MGKLFPAFLLKKRDGFCPAEAGFRRYTPQLLLLHSRQICNGSCTRTPTFATLRWAKRASARNKNPAP